MRWGIVGPRADKFHAPAEAWARYRIRELLKPGDEIVTGACPEGGVDIWAEEIGLQLGLRMIVHPPVTRDWNGFKARNIKIAEDYEEGVCVSPRALPSTYRGTRSKGCYHCGRDDHVVSGGCWTLQYGRRLGKPGRVIIV